MSGSDDQRSLRRRWPVVVAIVAARLYLFGMLFVLFLTTDLRQERDDFVFRRDGQSAVEREDELRRSFVDRLTPLDGQFYIDIANRGYRAISWTVAGEIGNYAFFPLLPGLLATLKPVFPESYVAIAMCLLVLAGAAGTIVLWSIAEKCRVNAFLAVAALVCFPNAPFQHVLYTEGLFLLLSGLAILSALRKDTPWALCFGVLAGLCRPQGVLLAIPLFVELVLPDLKARHKVSPLAWMAAIGPCAGFLVMGLVSQSVGGSVFAFLSVQTNWGRSFEAGGMLKAIASVFGYGGPPMDLLGVLVAVGCLPIMWKRLPLSLSLYGTAAVLMPLSTGSLLSFGRFVSVSVPHMLALSLFFENRPALKYPALAIFLALQFLLARGLVGWHFVG